MYLFRDENVRLSDDPGRLSLRLGMQFCHTGVLRVLETRSLDDKKTEHDRKMTKKKGDDGERTRRTAEAKRSALDHLHYSRHEKDVTGTDSAIAPPKKTAIFFNERFKTSYFL